MATDNSPGKRLALFRETLGLSQKAFATEIGVSKGYVGSLEGDIRQPSRGVLTKISERYGVSADWLLEGRGPMTHAVSPGFSGRLEATRITPTDKTRPGAGDFTVDGEDFVLVRRMDISASAGSGLIPISDAVDGRLAFTTRWMTKNGINADLCALVAVKGDSMAPTIPDGALVLVHAAEKALDRPGIYAFSDGDEVFVKRLAPLWDDAKTRMLAVVVTSDNPTYPARSISGPDAARINIAGRVRCILTEVD